MVRSDIIKQIILRQVQKNNDVTYDGAVGHGVFLSAALFSCVG